MVKSWKGWIDTNLFWPCMICRYLFQLYRPFPNLKAFALIWDAQKRSKAENETLVHWIFFNARIGRSMNNSTYILVSVYTYFSSSISHTSYLSFFLHEQNFWRIKFTLKKRVNYDKIHSKLPIFCVITAKYTVNCQFFALNL